MKYVFIFLLSASILYGKDFIVSYRGPESNTDIRFEYPLAIIRASLDATVKEYGSYKLIPVFRLNNKRAQAPDYVSTLDNFLFDAAISSEREAVLQSIKIPTSKGIFGYRVFIINKKDQPIFDKITSIEDLKKISFGQNDSWLDYLILKDAGFNVIAGNNYDGLFSMLAGGRFQAFPRGINEAYKEVEQKKKEFPELTVEKNICLYYPLPRYFYTSKNNKLLIERMTKGMEIIIANGTFDKIWTKYNIQSINQSELKKRKIFYIENKYLPPDILKNTKKYMYNIE